MEHFGSENNDNNRSNNNRGGSHSIPVTQKLHDRMDRRRSTAKEESLKLMEELSEASSKSKSKIKSTKKK